MLPSPLLTREQGPVHSSSFYLAHHVPPAGESYGGRTQENTEETGQVSKTGVARMLELSEQNFRQL